MSTSKSRVMLTGGTGYIGSGILLALLRAGHTVHVVVRSEAKQSQVASAPALLSLLREVHGTADVDAFCKFFIVPDLTVRGSLDAAARGCTRVIHAASPLPHFECSGAAEQRAQILAPAVACTLSALESAKASGTVERVVCTSSVGAFAAGALLGPGYAGTEEVHVNESSLQPHVEPPFPDVLTAYCASKATALRRSLEWMAAERAKGPVGFDLVALGPAYVGGRHPLAASTKDLWDTSNFRYLRLITAAEKGEGPKEVACAAHVDDVVDLHLMALDREKVKTKGEGEEGAGTELFTVAVDMLWEDVTEATKKLFPAEVEKGVLPNAGYVGTHSQVKFYSEKVEKAFGIKLKGVEAIVESLVSQYLELLEKEK
ncbi:putative nadph-dependent [Diplodia seriata]|uniref:Putative nadph-dependent n=1 Tax=Diplodia seriata TaxID=420778 RepID=A0A0G2ED49_9PEZI|nr:putative nadph-dependent [Diplodia seriata]